MKPRKMKLKWKILIILLSFITVIIAFLWIFQLVLLEDVYRAMKVSELRKNAETITSYLDREELSAVIEHIAYREDLSVILIDTEGNILEQQSGKFSTISHFSEVSILERVENAKKHKGYYTEIIPYDQIAYADENFPFEDDVPGVTDNEKAESVVYTKIVKNGSGAELGLIVESTITPINTTFRTMIAQLTMATTGVLLMAVVITAVLSKSVAKPIESLTETAKELAKGKNVQFDGIGFRELEELRDTLNYASNELATVERFRRELLSNVSHDLRTPLTLIKGYTELMRDIPSENTSENAQTVIDETERLTILVNDMLDLSKLQGSEVRLNLAEFDIVPVIRNVAARHKKLLEKENYSIECVTEESAFVYADEVKITQVIYNLLSNAVNYTGEDKKIYMRQFQKGKNVRIEIIDTGIGIDVDILPHIWDRYYKSDRSHRRASIGTGLGLSIVKNVMSKHPGGVYGVESSRGNGSNFYIELPKIENK